MENKLIITLVCLFFLQPCLTFAARQNRFNLTYQYGDAVYTPDFNTGSGSISDSHRESKITFDYTYNKYLSGEFYYANLGSIKVTGDAGLSFTHNGATTTFTSNNSEYLLSYRAVGANVLLKSSTKDSYFYAKLGALYWKNDYQLSSAGVVSNSGSKSGFAPLAGIGFRVPLPLLPSITLRIDYDITKIDNNQLYVANFGLGVSF